MLKIVPSGRGATLGLKTCKFSGATRGKTISNFRELPRPKGGIVMKYARIFTLAVVTITAVILFATIGAVKPSGATASEWTVVKLTSDAADHLQTTVSTNRVAWTIADGPIYRIFTQKIGVDLTPVPVNTGDATDASWMEISGDRIVWQDNYGGSFNIYTKKIGVDTEPQLVSIDTDTYDIWPEVSGDRIVWYGSTELFTRKMGVDSTCTLVADNTPVTDSVQVSGDRIVWAAYAGYSDQIFTMKVGSDPGPVQLTTVGEHRSPVVSGDRVVWEGKVDGYWQLFTQKIGTDSSPIQLTTLPFDSGAARVSGDRIVWFENYQVFTRKMGVDSARVLLSSDRALGPRVSGDRVIWWESVNGTYQLIAEDIGSGDPPVQLTSASGGQAEVSGEYVTWVTNVGGYNQVFVAHATLPVKPVATTIKLSTTSKSGISYGAATTLKGTLLASGKAVPGAIITLQKSTNGTTFSNVTTGVTTSTGAFSFSVKQTIKTWYRVSFAGNDNYIKSGPTASIYLIPKVYLSNAVAPTTIYHNKYFTVYNYLKPLHTAGTYPVRVYKWRYVSGEWKSYGYVSLKAYNYSTFTKCTRSISLPYSGKWRLRIYAPADSKHAATWSEGYRYITVT